MKRKRDKAQHLIEFAILICLVAAALVAMRVYFVRGVQERYRRSAEVLGGGEQYAKGITKITNLDVPGITLGDVSSGGTGGLTCPDILQIVSRLGAGAGQLGSKLDDLNNQVKQLGAEISQLPDSINQLNSQIKDIQDRMPQLQAQANRMRAQAEAWKKQAQGIQARADVYLAQAKAWRDEAAQLRKEVAETNCLSLPDGLWGGRRARCFSEKEEKLESAAKLDKQVARNEQRAQPLVAQAQDLFKRAGMYFQEIPNLERAVKEAGDRINDLNNRLQDLQGRGPAMGDNLNNLKNQVKILQAEIDKKQAEIDGYKGQRPECFN